MSLEITKVNLTHRFIGASIEDKQVGLCIVFHASLGPLRKSHNSLKKACSIVNY